jgi:SSS family transporter
LNQWIVAALVAYLVIQFFIAYTASRFIKVEADYFVAGRRLGVYAVAMSVFATWFGAESVMGASGAVAQEGLAGGSADPFGYTLALLGMATFLAFKMREAGVITFVDFFRQRFGPTANWMAAVLSIPTSVIWASAQLLAMGEIVAAVTGMDLTVGLMIGAAVIIVYTTVGGLLGDVITDIVQGTVLVVGLAILLAVVLMTNEFSLANIRPEQLSLSGFNEAGEPEGFLSTLNRWMIPIVGSLVAQEAIARFLGATSASVARKGCYIAAGLYLSVGMIPVIIGLVGTAAGFVPSGQDAFLPELAQQYLNPIMYVILMGALVSAILSTVDTTLLAVSALTTRNLIEPSFPNLSEKARLRVGRTMSAIAGLVALFIAASGETIKGLVDLASSFGSAGIVVALLFGLHTRFGDERAAVSALIVGSLLSFVGDGHVGVVTSPIFSEDVQTTMPMLFFGWEGGFVFSIVGALAAYVAVAWFTSRRPQIATAD